jgi:dATP pyrophosphohydrolase
MARAPFQVLVFPYRVTDASELEYAVLKRADEGYWHVVAGGGEADERPLEAAKREAFEEIGVPEEATFLELDTVFSVPVTIYRNSHIWGEEQFVIPCYCFAVLVEGHPIRLSKEHLEHRWVPYAEAQRLLRFDNNKTALWELDRRLRGKGPRV